MIPFRFRTLALTAMLGAAALPASAQLSGSYTINSALPTSGINYQSFGAAVNALVAQGVSGPVSFSVSGGPYTEQVSIPAIAGASAANSIRFLGNGSTITFNPTNATQRHIIRLNGADHIGIDSLNIVATGTAAGEYGYGVHLYNGADSNIISRCSISLSKTTDKDIAYQHAGIVINSGVDSFTKTGNSGCDGNVIRNNTITGGYIGISLVADGTTSTIPGNRVIGNTLQDFYNVGIYLNGNVGALIEGNDISRPARPLSPHYLFLGIYLQGPNSGLLISKNRIHDPFGYNPTAGSGCYAMYIQSSPGTPAAENVIVNNAIYNINSTGIAMGIDLTNSSYFRILHNSISLDDAANSGFGSTRGIALNGGANNVTVNNNVVSILRGGGGEKNCIYLASNVTGFSANNNDWFMGAFVGIRGVGKFGSANHTTLAAWQTATGQDAASLNADPQYVSLSNLLPTSAALATAGLAAGVATDIRGALRSAAAPTMGAFEMNATLCAAPTALSASAITANGALAGWSSAAAFHRVQYGLAGFTPGSGTLSAPLGNNSYTIGGLLPSMYYDFYVKDSCGPNSSSWAGPFRFMTACQPPVVELGANATVCAGSAFNLSPGIFANASYLWQNGDTSNTVAVAGSGAYWVRVTNAYGCAASDTVQIAVLSRPGIDSIGVLPTPGNPFQYNFTAYGATGANSMTWNFGDGDSATAQNIQHTYSAPGTYTVTFRLRNACGDTVISRQINIWNLGAGNFNPLGAGCYPNPATDALHIRLAANAPQSVEAKVYDAGGRELRRQIITGHNGLIDVRSLSAGFYQLRLSAEGQTATLPFSKL